MQVPATIAKNSLNMFSIFNPLGQRFNGQVTSLCVPRPSLALRSQKPLTICLMLLQICFLWYSHDAQEI